MSEHQPTESVLAAVATLRAQHTALDRRICDLEGDLLGLRTDLEKKHSENRKSIHDLRNTLQSIHDGIHGLELKLSESVSRIDVRLARMTGYALGAGAAIGLVAELTTKVMDHIWK